MTLADETLIGEGVALDTAAASLGSRSAAALLDGTIILAVYLGTFLLLGQLVPQGLDFAALTALVLTHLIAVFLGIPITLETLTRGRSVGKIAAGIRVVRDDGGPIAFRQSFTRGLIGFFELWLTLGGIALVASASNGRGKRVGDMFAGTYALRTRVGARDSLALAVPYSLIGWAAAVDIRRLPDGLALAIRQFLTRAQSLHPTSRRQLGESLAAQLAPYASPPPPPGTHPETFMMAVLAVRRDREYAIELRNLEADAAQAHAVHRLPFDIYEPG